MPGFERKGVSAEKHKQPDIDIDSVEEASDFIRESIEAGIFPIISVPDQYVDAARKGIKPHTTWIGERIIAGTIGRDPYLPSTEQRHLFKIHVSADAIEPRFTGNDKHFHGVVVFRGPILPTALEAL